MSRKRSVEQLDLFQATEKIVLTSGYGAFHFKSLAAELGVARSTIYNYYTKKEELIADYMVHMLKQVIAKMKIQLTKKEPLKEVIRLFSSYAHMHQMFQIMPYIDQNASQKVQTSMREMFQLLGEMREIVSAMIEDYQDKKLVRTDLAKSSIVGMVMATVRVPVGDLDENQWTEDVYKMLIEGIGTNKS